MSRLSIGRCRYWYGIWHGMCLEGQEAVETQQKGREESEQDPSAASPAAATAAGAPAASPPLPQHGNQRISLTFLYGDMR